MMIRHLNEGAVLLANFTGNPVGNVEVEFVAP